ncbi:MAG: hypothetical protein KJ072_14370 [Verrucomicrobia bacterium]|nr:hypothetical protein [Verrucomicrobiota bacterium]
MRTTILALIALALTAAGFATASDQNPLPQFAILPNDVIEASLTVSQSEPFSFVLVLTKEASERLAGFTKRNIDKQVLVTIGELELASPKIKTTISNPTLTLPVGDDLHKYISILKSLAEAQK